MKTKQNKDITYGLKELINYNYMIINSILTDNKSWNVTSPVSKSNFFLLQESGWIRAGQIWGTIGHRLLEYASNEL